MSYSGPFPTLGSPVHQRRQEVPAQETVLEQNPCAQPSEPFLIPKLRNDFADFPHLPYSTDQRLSTLET